MHHKPQGERRTYQDNEAVGPDLCQHDCRRVQRHDQKMLDGAMFALPDELATGENHGQQGDVVDDFHHADEPRASQVGVKPDARGKPLPTGDLFVGVDAGRVGTTRALLGNRGGFGDYQARRRPLSIILSR